MPSWGANRVTTPAPRGPRRGPPSTIGKPQLRPVEITTRLPPLPQYIRDGWAPRTFTDLWNAIDKASMARFAGGRGCWLWRAKRNRSGYGYFKTPGSRVPTYTHIYIYKMLRGPYPVGLELDHRCRVRRCCNPDHLEPVTHAENVRRITGRTPAQTIT